MNSARAANYFLKHRGVEGKVTYFGAIGTDDKGEVLEQEIADQKINGNFHKDTETPTGTCAVLVALIISQILKRSFLDSVTLGVLLTWRA